MQQGITRFVVRAVFVLALLFSFNSLASAQEAPVIDSPQPFIMAGTVEGVDTHFTITDSEYLNVTLDSSEQIKLRMESVPEMVTMMIEPSASSTATSTQITLSGLATSTTYYKYEDDYHNLTTLEADESGNYFYTEDLSKPHLIFIQPRHSTKFIRDDATGGGCSLIGSWDTVAKTCTLNVDVNETIQIDSNGITLDGNGHTLTGSYTGSGIYLPERTGVTVKNLSVKQFGNGIYLSSSSGNTLTNNTTLNNHHGLPLYYSSGNALTNNTVSNNAFGIFLNSSSNNTLIGNTVLNNILGIPLFSSSGNTLTNNTASNNSFGNGIYLSSSSGNILTNNTASNNGHDGISLYSSSNNTLIGNTVSNNSYGLFLYYSIGNQIYNNNFINNLRQDYDNTSINTFNLASPIGGNYWSNFDTASEGCNDLNNDNFCDSPYVFYGGQDNLPWTKQDGWKACTVNCYSNVLFLPGLEASRLYKPDYNGGTDQLWEPTSDADAPDLLLDANGDGVRGDVYTKDVIGIAYGIPGKGNIYTSFIDQMDALKTAGIINDWGTTPYDWRLSLDDILNNGNELSGGRVYYTGVHAATSSPYIIQELKRLASTSKTGKVTIVAHSNGGLVTKALTQKLGAEASNLIDKIIFVAVPQVGTPKAIGAILHGYDQGLLTDAFSVFFSEQAARTLAKNMPAAYNLLPSANYFAYVDDPVVIFDKSALLAPWRTAYGDEIHSKERLHTFIADQSRTALPVSNDLTFPISGNETLLNNAETLHSTTLDNWTPPTGVLLYEVAGWGEKTLKTINYYQGWKTYCSDLTASTCPYYITVPALEYGVKDVLDGDGTVMVPSALWTATATTTGKYWVDLMKYDQSDFGTTIERKHADILEVPSLRALIQNVLTNSISTTPLVFISTSTPPNLNPDTRLRFTLHSPLTLNLYDDLGNHTGFSTTTGFLEENIPGSRYKTYGELKYIEASASTTLRLVMDGYTTGSFTLDVTNELGDTTIASTTFAAIPSSTTTIATITVPQGGSIAEVTPLLVDYDGNGVTDFSLKPQLGKISIFDITPPEAVLTFDPVLQKLKIIGIDNLSSTTVSTTATSTIVTDEAWNTLKLIFKKLKQERKELKLELQTLIYNGVSTSTPKETKLQYEWSTDKAGKIKELEQKATAGTMKIEAHYDAKKNVTKVEKKMKDEGDDNETKETFEGLRILKFVTDKGSVRVDY